MKCTNCEMVNQTPGTNCSHCGRPIPAAAPIFSEAVDELEDGAETPATEEEKTEDSGGPQTEEAPAAEEEVELEKGHVDNVGDEAETPVP